MPRRKTPPANDPTGVMISGTLGKSIVTAIASLLVTAVLAMFNMHTSVQTLKDTVTVLQQSQQLTQKQLDKHLDNAVDKTDYLRDKAHTDAVIENMATKDDVRLLRDMILDLCGNSSRVSKYR